MLRHHDGATALTWGVSAQRAVRLLLVLTMVALLGVVAPPPDAHAQSPGQVTGLTVEQAHGQAMLRWAEVPGATDYQIERTPVDASNQATAAGVIVGVWRPNRTVTPELPAFADAGFKPGDRFGWRVRARFGTEPQPYSDSVFDTTQPKWGDPAVPGESLRTQWETTDAAQYTSDTEEYAYTSALDAASDRVRVVEIGRTVQDRPINMFIIGYPKPPATAQEISDSPTALVNCNVHGNEPSSRESCLIMARELAFGTDARTIDVLSHTTVLLVPSINGDGRAANTRGNISGQDLNRDHSKLTQPETMAFAAMLRDYTPQAAFDGHEYGNSSAGDLPVLPPRHLNVAQPIFDQSQDMIERHMYGNGSADGWWYCPYGCQGGATVGMSEETILRNAMGLKNTMGSLLEARSSGGATRPDEANTQNNRRRKTYSALYTYHQFLDYHRANEPAIAKAIADSIAFQVTNTGPIVWRGSRDIEPFPAPHPGESPPNTQPATGGLETPPCGYQLTADQYRGLRTDGPTPLTATTLEQRIAAHGWTVVARGDGFYVPLAQPQRGLIPLLLDGSATEPWTSAERVPCDPKIEVSPPSMSVGATEGASVPAALAISNTQQEAGHNLSWQVTEAESDCSTPSDLGWLSTSPAQGTTPPGGSTDVTVTFDAAGLTAPETRSGVLCLTSNDQARPTVAIPVDLSVRYPFSGFVSPTSNPPAVNSATAGRSTSVKFAIAGARRGLDILAAQSPASRQVDCASLAATGPAEETSPDGTSGLKVAKNGVYTYTWQTAGAWKGTCREFLLGLNDGSTHTALYRFR